MNTLFICSEYSYNFKHVLVNLNERVLKAGYKSYCLYGHNELKNYKIGDNTIPFSNSFFYGKNYFNYNPQNKRSYFYNKYKFLKELNSAKKEVLEIIDSNNIQMVIVFDTFDIAVGVVASFRKSIPIHYIQHSMIQAELEQLTYRQRYDNYLSYFFCGFCINRNTRKPPFNFKNINYVLWSELWANNIDLNQYKIKFFPKMLNAKGEDISERAGRNKIQNILVILNKKRNIGKKNWILFANFYKKYFNKSSYNNVTFKAHPSENIKFCKDNLKNFKVVKEDIDIRDYDLVLSHWSTFIFESALSNVPFILINPKNLFSYKYWRLDHYPLIVSDIEKLDKIINEINDRKININKILSDFVLKSLGDRSLSSWNGLFRTIFYTK